MAGDNTPSWQVIAQREDVQSNPNGTGYVNGTVVTFRLAGGSIGTVFVPEGERYEERAREAVIAKAAAMAAVAQLQG